MSIFYNVATIDISSGLTDHEISSGQDYFILLDAPTNANVTVKLNENTAPAIPIKEYWQFKSKDVQNIYLSCNAVSGESIKYGQADGNLEITTNPVINSIDSITSLKDVGASATNLNKIINPYDIHNSATTKGTATNTAVTTILNETLTCDKIKVNLSHGLISTGGYPSNSFIKVLLDDVIVMARHIASNNIISDDNNMAFEDVNGKNLKIIGQTASASYPLNYTVQKTSLKA